MRNTSSFKPAVLFPPGPLKEYLFAEAVFPGTNGRLVLKAAYTRD